MKVCFILVMLTLAFIPCVKGKSRNSGQEPPLAYLSLGARILFSKNVNSFSTRALDRREQMSIFKLLGLKISKNKRFLIYESTKNKEYVAETSVNIIDLNADGDPEVFVAYSNRELSPPGGEEKVFAKKPLIDYSPILELFNATSLLTYTRNSGYPDILSGGPGFLAGLYVWNPNAKKYVFTRQVSTANDGGPKIMTFCEYADNHSLDKSFDLTKVPQIMRKQSPAWEVAARLQEEWFNRRPYENSPVMDVVTMDWFLSFEYTNHLFNTLMNNQYWLTPAAKALTIKKIKSLISEKKLILPKYPNRSVSFDATVLDHKSFVYKDELNKDYSQVSASEKYYIQSYQFTTGNEIGAYRAGDKEIVAALGLFEIRFVPKFTITLKENDYYEISINKIGAYIIDSYDFNDSNPITSQPLGCWDVKSNEVFVFSSECAENAEYINNKTYREWSDCRNRGGNFIIYSDVKVFELNSLYNIFKMSKELVLIE